MCHRPLSVLLLLVACVSAQWGDFLGKALGKQKPLVSEETRSAVVEKLTHDVTTDNWRGLLNVSVEAITPDEWILYFTTPAVNATARNSMMRNVTFWDGVFNDTVYTVSTTRPLTPLHFGKANCSAPETSTLCNSFFLTSPIKLPAFYHAISYPNSTVELRQVPFSRNLTSEELPTYVAKFHSEGLWTNVDPWTGVFNPVDGALKIMLPYLGIALKGWEMMPQWLFMLVVSFLGRNISSRIVGRVNWGRAPPPETS